MNKMNYFTRFFLISAFATVVTTHHSYAAQVAPDTQSDELFDSEVKDLRQIRLIGDIEGQGIHFESLVADGLIKWDEKNQRWDLPNKKTILIFNGDFMRRGPFAIRAVKIAIDLQNRYPHQVRISIGNHDGNILSFFPTRANIEAGLDENYQAWIQKSNRVQNLASEVFYWAEKMGVREKIENYWLELVLMKLGATEKDFHLEYQDQFYKEVDVNGRKQKKIDLDKLNSIISVDHMAQEFYDFISPGKNPYGGWRTLELGTLRDSVVSKAKDGQITIFDFSHSGMSSVDNFGVIPTTAQKYIPVKGDENLVSDPRRGLDPNRPDLRLYYFRWLKDLNSQFKDAQLKALAERIDQFEKAEGDLASKRTLAEDMGKFEIIHNVDAKWAEATGMFYRSDSQVYPDPRQFLDSALPAIADTKTLAAQAKIGITFTMGGHKPVGDIALLMLGFDPTTQKFVRSMFHDTSYSPVEGNNRSFIWENGAVRVIGQTREGKTILIESPGVDTLKKWTSISNQWKQKQANAKLTNQLIEIPEQDKKIIERLERYSRLGRVSGGRLIAGFTMQRNDKGELVPNYDNYLTVRQEGYNFFYQEIDIWGLMEYEKNNGPLDYAQADLTLMLEKAEKEKAEGLKLKLKKNVLSEKTFLKALEGKTIYWLFGPSANIAQVEQDPISNKYIANESLPAWESELMHLPASEEIVILTGGTLGWESKKTEVVERVNQFRKKQKMKPIRVIGCAALVFGLGEADPLIKDFFLIPKTFYWNDYFENLMNQYVLKSKAKSIHLDYAGGGGIVSDQIGQAIKFAGQDRRIQITLERGVTVSPGDQNHKKRGATDKWADKMMAQPDLAGNYNFLSIVQATGSKFINLFGRESVRAKLTADQPRVQQDKGPSCHASFGR